MSPDDPRHGTDTGYTNGGCREECCKRAHALRKNLWRLGRCDKQVPVLGTRRRVEALMALGYSQRFIAEQAGHSRDYLNKTLKRRYIYASSAAKIAEVYERLCMTPAADTGYSRRVAALAREAGYALPLAWLDIDDPNEVPDAWRSRKYRATELVEEWEFLRRQDVHIEEAARRLGLTVGAIEKAIERASGRAA